MGRDCPLNFHFFLQVKIVGIWKVILLWGERKKILKQNLIIGRRDCYCLSQQVLRFKGRFVLQEAAFGSHLRRTSSFFASLIIPFVLSGSSDKSHGTSRKAILNPRFSCQMYRRLKPDRGGHQHSPCCLWAGLNDSQPLAVPGAQSPFTFCCYCRFHTSGGEN